MKFSETRSIRFSPVTHSSPSMSEIKRGILAHNKLTGAWEPIAKSTYSINVCRYDMFMFADQIPSYNDGYADKYADLVKAKNILKEDRYDYDNVGQAIGLIKRFLKNHGKS